MTEKKGKGFPFVALYQLIVFSLLQYWQLTKVFAGEANAGVAAFIVFNTILIAISVVKLFGESK